MIVFSVYINGIVGLFRWLVLLCGLVALEWLLLECMRFCAES